MSSQSLEDDSPTPSTQGSGVRVSKLALKRIHDRLGKRDLSSLKFLCFGGGGGGSVIPAGRLEKVTTPLELFAELENVRRIRPPEDVRFLAELLGAIGRVDLVSELYGGGEVATPRGETNHASGGEGYLVDPYRLMLYGICEELTKKDVDALKFLCLKDGSRESVGLPRSVVDKVTSAEELVLALEKQTEISENDLDLLVTMLRTARRLDLVSKIDAFRGCSNPQKGNPSKMGPEDKAAIASKVAQRSNGEAGDAGRLATKFGQLDLLATTQARNIALGQHSAGPQYQRAGIDSLPNNVISERHAMPVDRLREEERLRGTGPDDAPGTGPGDAPMLMVAAGAGDAITQPSLVPRYDMKRKPRGRCVIINNMNFIKVEHPSSRMLNERRGSDVDEESLTKLFRDQLGFRVIRHHNLSDEDMVKAMWHEASVDHTEFDGFVCIVLSHGSLGAVYGTNGLSVEIGKLMTPMKIQSCSSLRNKPKLFFLQACQDLDTDDDVLPEMVSTIPSEYDFLLGYSTLPGSAAYRSRTRGSWYISSLVRMLSQYAGSLDLLSILTEVNNDVAGQVVVTEEGGTYYQCPAPIHTLRRQIVFE